MSEVKVSVSLSREEIEALKRLAEKSDEEIVSSLSKRLDKVMELLNKIDNA